MQSMLQKMGLTTLGVATAVLLLSLVLGGCIDTSPKNPGVDSDSPQSYHRTDIPVDTAYYTISGTVDAGPESVVRQTDPGRGSLTGVGMSGSGVITGSSIGPEYAGKSVVRLMVSASDSPLAPPERVVILKASDIKAVGLLPGDHVTFVCRAQYEAVGAVMERERIDLDAAATWELDYCRLTTPTIGP